MSGHEDMAQEAWQLISNAQLAATTMIQRKLRVGFVRAGRIMDDLHDLGLIGPYDGSRARTILVDNETGVDLIAARNRSAADQGESEPGGPS